MTSDLRPLLQVPAKAGIFSREQTIAHRMVLMEHAFVTTIREEVLRDPRYPVHVIADRLVPYLQVLVEQFHPEQVILFGSYAYGRPKTDSDVDLLIIKADGQSPVEDAIAIRRAWRPVRRVFGSLPFDLLVVSIEEHQRRLQHAAGFYDEIVQHGIRLV